MFDKPFKTANWTQELVGGGCVMCRAYMVCTHQAGGKLGVSAIWALRALADLCFTNISISQKNWTN